MIEYRKLAIPAIFILILGGVISFFLAFTFYPEKHVNVSIDGKCYELIDNANEKYQKLVAYNRLQILKMQIKYIEWKDAKVPLLMTGYEDMMDDFLKKYHFKIVEEENITNTANPSLNKKVIKAIISKSELSLIINQSQISDFFPYSESIVGSLGIQPTQYLTIEEGKSISKISNQLIYNGLKEIITSKDGVKSAECRNIQLRDSLI